MAVDWSKAAKDRFFDDKAAEVRTFIHVSVAILLLELFSQDNNYSECSKQCCHQTS